MAPFFPSPPSSFSAFFPFCAVLVVLPVYFTTCDLLIPPSLIKICSYGIWFIGAREMRVAMVDGKEECLH
ncbi:uncharacterized protein THITE_2109976, partial [Thermothielavioides terrestris NRRL 8126]